MQHSRKFISNLYGLFTGNCVFIGLQYILKGQGQWNMGISKTPVSSFFLLCLLLSMICSAEKWLRGVTYANLVFQFLEKLIITQSINHSRSRYRAPVEIALGIYKLQGPRLTYALTATKLVVTVVLQTLTHLLFLNENLWIRYSVSVWCILITKADKQKQKQQKNKKKTDKRKLNLREKFHRYILSLLDINKQ